jgi:TM2 domain-containing membrane protein YozV
MSDANVLMQYDAYKKSTLLTYLLWWFLGSFGAHRFYLGKTGSAILMLALFWGSALLMLVVIGFLTFWIPFLWWCVDAFLIPGYVREHNMLLAARLNRGGFGPIA